MPTKMIKVYIADSHAYPKVSMKIRSMIRAAASVEDMGKHLDMDVAPFISFLAFGCHSDNRDFSEYDHYINFSQRWILFCDCVLCLSRKSRISEIEELYAQRNNIPVFYSLDELKNFLHQLESEKNNE